MAEKKLQGSNVGILDYILSDDGLFMLEMWMRDGYTYGDIADTLKVSEATLIKWRKKYPQIEEAMAQGRAMTDYKVENALLKVALGYKTKEVKTTTIMRYGKVVETQREVLEKEQAPNVSAIQMWLCNRNKEKWSMPNSKNLLEEMEEDSTIQVTVTRASKNEGDATDEDGDEINESVKIEKKAKPAMDNPLPDSAWAEVEGDEDYDSEDWDDEEWAVAEEELAD